MLVKEPSPSTAAATDTIASTEDLDGSPTIQECIESGRTPRETLWRYDGWCWLISCFLVSDRLTSWSVESGCSGSYQRGFALHHGNPVVDMDFVLLAETKNEFLWWIILVVNHRLIFHNRWIVKPKAIRITHLVRKRPWSRKLQPLP